MARTSQIISVPAPIKGWNVRDPLPMMTPDYGPVMDNVFCLPSELMVRKGYTKWATGFTGIAESLLEYNPLNGVQQIYAAVNNSGSVSIYDISNSGAVGSAKVTGLTNGKFKQVSFATSGGNFSYYVNGADNATLYDGTTWYSVTDVSATYAITGPSNTHFRDVISHKRRLWFVPQNSMSCWYLPTDQIAGAAVKFDFAPIFPRGGYITKINTWSLDAGTGLDDYFVVFSSEGEVAVYSGTDPASASTWSLTGVFYIGSPTGRGFTCKFGGDLLIINKDGVAQMSKSLMSSRVNTWLQLTDKIQPQLAQDTSTYADNADWDLLLYPPQNMLMVNVPVSSSETYQYVMNTISGAWSRWKGLNARCWYFINDQLYFGSNGYVGLAWNTQSDDGADITADVLPAYQNHGQGSQLKFWSMARILVGASSDFSYGTRMELDFNLNTKEFTTPSAVQQPTAVYGTSLYGSSVYGGQIQVKKVWANVSGMGYWGSLHIKMKSKYADVRLYSYDLTVAAGGNI
jgi:hypothetical protein